MIDFLNKRVMFLNDKRDILVAHGLMGPLQRQYYGLPCMFHATNLCCQTLDLH